MGREGVKKEDGLIKLTALTPKLNRTDLPDPEIFAIALVVLPEEMVIRTASLFYAWAT
ncbi:hypothetical protein GCM10011383_19080 [Hymenobacter cavernae]|uniref:Uncharacterized protein n=1 Tax=Hymenobacter cavernae TaxID=2044852 RepID=A0ABQ1U2Z9_9BACT|nr:hypothetical protein GCM10011383_19080 [Hymenobacter cavernae]